MKKFLFLVLAVSIFAIPAFANIPSKVEGSFKAKYGTASHVEWKHGLFGDYKALFVLEGYQYKAKFDKKGNWIETQKIMSADKLPGTVRNSFHQSKYNQWEIKETYELYLPNHRPQYHIDAAKSEFKRKHLLFDDRGELMNG